MTPHEWTHDESLTSQRESTTKSTDSLDPLGDVIDWIEHSELQFALDDLTEEDGPSPSSSSNAGKYMTRSSRVSAMDMPHIPPLSDRSKGGFIQAGIINRSHAGGAEPPLFKRVSMKNRRAANLQGCCIVEDGDYSHLLSKVDDEEQEWDARQKQTGAAGRLVVYERGEKPQGDILLRGGKGRRVIVTAVTEGGKAAQAGVKAGDVLASIDGKKDFREKPAEVVHASLTAPAVLVFMGFVGKLQAEVRLNYKQKLCGLSTRHQVVLGRPNARVQVTDEVVFHPGSAPLFLATSSTSRSAEPSRGSSSEAGGEGQTQQRRITDLDDPEGTGEPGPAEATPSEPQGPGLTVMYELRNYEARLLVNRALSRAKMGPPIPLEAREPARSPDDHAQVPRTMVPTPSPLGMRISKAAYEAASLSVFEDKMPSGRFHESRARPGAEANG